MKRAHYVCFVTLFTFSCQVSEGEWSDVKEQLTDVKHKEQKYRSVMDSVGQTEGWQSKQIEILWAQQKVLDSLNLMLVNRVIDRFGFPSKDKIGDLTETIFTVLQNDKNMADYYELIVGAGKKGDLKMIDVAPYQDRVLLARRVPQEYGTQVWIDYKTDPKTGERYDSLYLWEVRDPAHVNERRLAAGLDSLETALRRFNIDPKTGYLIRRQPAGRVGK